jgi:hypothetical protein
VNKLVVYPEGTDQPGYAIEVANGFVARVVGDIAERNLPDAERVAAILNAEVEKQIATPIRCGSCGEADNSKGSHGIGRCKAL